MKKLLCGVLVAIVAVTAFGQDRKRASNSKVKDEQEIRDLLRAWDEAHGARDTVALDRILAADFVYTDANGTLQTRAEYLMSVVKAPDVDRLTFESSDLVVRVSDDVAVVTGQSTWKGRARGRGQFMAGQYRFTDVWVRRNGSWKAVATHGTSITK